MQRSQQPNEQYDSANPLPKTNAWGTPKLSLSAQTSVYN